MKRDKITEEKYRRYYASEFCKMTGLRADTLRFYVDKGLLEPAINQDHQYKEYCSKDVVDIAFVRSRRAMGVPIFNINEVLTKLPTEKQLEWYADHERQLQQEMDEIQMKLNRCRKAQRDLNNLPKLLNKIIDQSGEEGPDLYQLNLIGPNVSEGEERFVLAELWRDKAPHVLSMIHIPLTELLDPSCEVYSVTYGLVLPKWMITEEELLIREPAYLYPSKDCIGMMIRLEDPFVVTRSDLQPLFDYAKEKEYRFIDDMTSWLFARTMENGKQYYYFAMRVSVDKTGKNME